jgi:hypothetical protein
MEKLIILNNNKIKVKKPKIARRRQNIIDKSPLIRHIEREIILKHGDNKFYENNMPKLSLYD